MGGCLQRGKGGSRAGGHLHSRSLRCAHLCCSCKVPTPPRPSGSRRVPIAESIRRDEPAQGWWKEEAYRFEEINLHSQMSRDKTPCA